MINPERSANTSTPAAKAKKSFNVRINLGSMSAKDGEIWADSAIIDVDITSKGARDECIETWIVKARNSRSAIAKAEREIENAGVSGVRVHFCEER